MERLSLRITNQGKPITANRAVATLSSLMSHGGRKGAANPRTGVLRNPENKRRRYLSSEELERLGAALEAGGQGTISASGAGGDGGIEGV